jgi:hypothetical protein
LASADRNDTDMINAEVVGSGMRRHIVDRVDPVPTPTGATST